MTGALKDLKMYSTYEKMTDAFTACSMEKMV